MNVYSSSTPHSFELLETTIWRPAEGFWLLEYHLARMEKSAKAAGYTFEREHIVNALDLAAKKHHEPRRARWRLNQEGRCEIEMLALSEPPNVLNIHLADQAVDANDFFLQNKTTHREVYQHFLHRFKSFDDVLLFNQYQEITECCLANFICTLDGERVTPRTEAGLLPGTLRASLLSQHLLIERTLHREDLKHCSSPAIINSVKGECPVIIHGL